MRVDPPQSLAFGQLFTASELHEAAREDLGEPTPLTNAVGFVIACVEREAGDLFTELRKRYAKSLARDAAFASLLDSIGKRYFGIVPPTAPPNLFSMLQSMMAGQR